MSVLFDQIPTFDFEELHGKTLKILVSREVHPNGIYILTFGVDIKTGIAYLLNQKTRKKRAGE